MYVRSQYVEYNKQKKGQNKHKNLCGGGAEIKGLVLIKKGLWVRFISCLKEMSNICSGVTFCFH